MTLCEIGTMADWSAAYTPNSGPMDAVIKVQLKPERRRTSQEYIRLLRKGFARNRDLAELEFSFDAGGLIRGALNEGKSSPINIQLVGKHQGTLFHLADKILKAVEKVDGVVDARVLQKPDAPALVIEVDRKKAQQMGLNQAEIMKNVIAATNSSIMFNKRSFWIDPKSGNQYFVGVQYPDEKFQSYEDILNITITGKENRHGKDDKANTLRNVATIKPSTLATEVHHVNLQPAIDLTMNVEGKDLGHVSDEVSRSRTVRQEKQGRIVDPLRPRLHEWEIAGRIKDRAHRRIYPHARNLQEPRHRPYPGFAPHLFLDGRAR